MPTDRYRMCDSSPSVLHRMHLRIQVDINSLQGTVCAWVPPPPNDRLWFGFITAPELKAEVTPILSNDVRHLQPDHCCMQSFAALAQTPQTMSHLQANKACCF